MTMTKSQNQESGDNYSGMELTMANKVESKQKINLDAEVIFIKKLIDDLSYDMVRISDFFGQFPKDERINILREIEVINSIARTLSTISKRSES